MPLNKNQMARLYAIDKCLCSRQKYWTKEELLDAIIEETDDSIAERTLKEDLKILRENSQLKYEAPIKYCKINKGYFYTVPGYSIRNIALSETDIETLESASSILNHYKELSIFKNFTGTVDKVLNVVNIAKDKSGAGFHFLDLEKAPCCKGSHFLDELISRIRKKQVIEINYKKFTDKEEKKHIVHPYLLKEYRNRWYLLGYHNEKKSIITLGLDRMIAIQSTTISFIQQEFNPDLYFKNTIGLTYVNEPVQEIVLSFQPLQGEYIKTQPLHETQEIITDNETECVIRLRLIPNYELKERILAYGPFVKIIHPQSFLEEIKFLIAQMHNLYSSLS